MSKTRRNPGRWWWGIGLLLGSSSYAHAATEVGDAQVRANFETLAIHVPVNGVIEDLRGSLWVREAGGTEWKPGHPLALTVGDEGPAMAGVVLGLDEATPYDVRVVLEGGDLAQPVEVIASGTTRTDDVPAPTGTTWHVDPLGTETAQGTAADPLASIQAAIDRSEPGDVVSVAPGVYHEAVVIDHGGTPGAWITLRAEAPGVILDGSLQLPGDTGDTFDLVAQVADGRGVWALDLPPETGGPFVYVDGRRLFPYSDDAAPAGEGLAELSALGADVQAMTSPTFGYYGPSLGGAYRQPGTGRLFMVLREDGVPEEHDVVLPVLGSGITVVGSQYVLVEGFEVRYFGAEVSGTGRGIEVVDSSDIVVRGNEVHGVPWGIRIRKSARVTVEDNLVYDEMTYGLEWAAPWGAYENGLAHNQGISLDSSEADLVIRRNEVRGFVDGIVLHDGYGPNPDNVDIHHNYVTESRDDAIELDGSDVALKVWGNLVFENHTAFSLSACEVGPAFLVGNVVWRYFNESYKLKPRDSVGPIFVLHNTHYVDWPDEEGDIGIGIQIDHGPVQPPANPYVTFLNNIVYASDWARDDPGPTGIDRFEYNCWYSTAGDRLFRIDGATYPDLDAYQTATTDEMGSVEGDPLFVDPSGSDFHLDEASPCRSRGLPLPGINDASEEDPPDMGAFFSGVVEPPPDDGGEGGDSGDSGGTDSGGSSEGGTGGASESGGETSEGDSGSDGQAGATGGEGCSCRSSGIGHPSIGALLVVLLGGLRRRGRGRSGARDHARGKGSSTQQRARSQTLVPVGPVRRRSPSFSKKG